MRVAYVAFVFADEHRVYHEFGDANVVIAPHLARHIEAGREPLVQVSLANARNWLEG